MNLGSKNPECRGFVGVGALHAMHPRFFRYTAGATTKFYNKNGVYHLRLNLPKNSDFLVCKCPKIINIQDGISPYRTENHSKINRAYINRMTVVKFLRVAVKFDKYMAKIGQIDKSQSSGSYQNLVNGS